MESTTPIELSFPLPRSLDARIYLSITAQEKSILVFVTSAPPESRGPTPMGSFVYALPNNLNPNSPISTPLFSAESTVDFATRLGKLLARKTQRPVYVSNSMTLETAALGGTVEEEMEAFKKIVDVSMETVQGKEPTVAAAASGISGISIGNGA